MLSDQIVRNIVWLSILLFNTVIGLPMREEKNILFVSVPQSVPESRLAQVPLSMSHSPVFFQQYPSVHQSPSYQTRGPFDFVGQWIQQTPWLPIQINVPDVFQNIGNGISQASTNVQQLSQTVGNGVSQIAQNVGSGLGQFTQNVGNGFNQWMLQLGQRVPFLGNIVGLGNRIPNGVNNNGQIIAMVPVEYPGGQKLVLEEALEAFP